MTTNKNRFKVKGVTVVPRTPYVNFELFDENRNLVFRVKKRPLKKVKKDIEEALGFKL